MKTTAEKHLTAIHAGAVTKSNVIGIRKILAHVDRLRGGWSGNRSNATPDEADALERALGACRPIVKDPQLHASGLALLRSRRYAKRWTPEQAAIIADLSTFQLMRFERVNRGKGSAIVPVYRAATAKNASFAFMNIPWQSGGDGPEIVRDY